MRFNKKAKVNILTLVIIGVVGWYLISTGALSGLISPPGEEPTACPLDGFVSIGGQCVCLGVEDTSVTLTAQDAFNPGTTSNESVRYKINGGTLTRMDNGGTFTASPKDSIEYLVASEENDTTWYGVKGNFVVPCKGTKDVAVNAYRSPDTFTIRVFNEEGNLITETGLGTDGNETLAAGDVVNLPIDFETQFERGLPYGATATFRYTLTHYDDVVLSIPGVTQTNVIPTAYDSVNASYTVIAYDLPPMISAGKLAGTLSIDVDDSTAPTTAGHNITIEVWDKDYYINDQNEFAGPAVEDDNRVAIGIPGPKVKEHLMEMLIG